MLLVIHNKAHTPNNLHNSPMVEASSNMLGSNMLGRETLPWETG